MQPNILLIVTDQLTPMLMRTYRDNTAITPNLDRLASVGIQFDSAYSSCPVCAPARASLMAGRYISEIGTYDNAAPLGCDIPCIAHYLTNAGYDSVLSGKMHFVGPDQLHGFRERLTTDIYPSDFSWTRTRDWEGKPMWLPDGMTPGYVSDGVGPRRHTMYMEHDERTHFRALEYIRKNRSSNRYDDRSPRRKEADQNPFFLCVSYHNPHEPFTVPRKYWDMYDGIDIAVPDIPEDMIPYQNQMDRWLEAFHGLETKDVTNSDSRKSVRRAYYALVSYIDHLVGELVDELAEQGLLDSTVIAFTSDHGDMLCSRGMIQKRCFYEQSCRVPLIIKFPDCSHGGRSISTPVTLVDLLPTFADIAGLSTDDLAPHDGDSLLSITEHEDSYKDRIVFSEYHSEGVYAPCFMARWQQYKYIYIHGFDPRMYDVDEDPDEWHDLLLEPTADQREAADRLKRAVLDRFDPEMIEQDVRESIRRRMVIDPAMKRNRTYWDYTVSEDGTQKYIRPKSTAPEARQIPWASP